MACKVEVGNNYNLDADIGSGISTFEAARLEAIKERILLRDIKKAIKMGMDKLIKELDN